MQNMFDSFMIIEKSLQITNYDSICINKCKYDDNDCCNDQHGDMDTFVIIEKSLEYDGCDDIYVHNNEYKTNEHKHTTLFDKQNDDSENIDVVIDKIDDDTHDKNNHDDEKINIIEFSNKSVIYAHMLDQFKHHYVNTQK